MQYSVLGSDGNQYGPVDLATLKQWVIEGRVLPNSQITDNLSNRMMIASQMPELGLRSAAPAPPSVQAPGQGAPYTQYPRPGMEYTPKPVVQGSVIGSVIFRLCLAAGLAAFLPTGGLIVSSFTVYYSIRALINKDPNGVLCLILSLVGLAAVGAWTMYKVANRINQY